MLEREIKVFDANIKKWLKTKKGQFVLIKDDNVIGFYKSSEDALKVGGEKFGLESFLVREIAETDSPAWIPALALGLINGPLQHSVQGNDH